MMSPVDEVKQTVDKLHTIMNDDAGYGQWSWFVNVSQLMDELYQKWYGTKPPE